MNTSSSLETLEFAYAEALGAFLRARGEGALAAEGPEALMRATEEYGPALFVLRRTSFKRLLKLTPRFTAAARTAAEAELAMRDLSPITEMSGMLRYRLTPLFHSVLFAGARRHLAAAELMVELSTLRSTFHLKTRVLEAYLLLRAKSETPDHFAQVQEHLSSLHRAEGLALAAVAENILHLEPIAA